MRYSSQLYPAQISSWRRNNSNHYVKLTLLSWLINSWAPPHLFRNFRAVLFANPPRSIILYTFRVRLRFSLFCWHATKSQDFSCYVVRKGVGTTAVSIYYACIYFMYLQNHIKIKKFGETNRAERAKSFQDMFSRSFQDSTSEVGKLRPANASRNVV